MLLCLLIGLALIGLLGWGFIEAVLASPALVGSVGVAVIGALAVVWQQRESEKARLREARRARMEPIYYDLLGVMFQKLLGKKTRKTDQEIEEFFKDLKARQLTLGASSEVVQAFNRWGIEAVRAKDRGDDQATMLAWEQLLLAFRADLGHDDSQLPKEELLRLFISDFDSHFPATGPESVHVS